MSKASLSGLGVGAFVLLETRQEYHYALHLIFKITKSEAEYKALLASLTIVSALRAREVEMKVDCEVIVN